MDLILDLPSSPFPQVFLPDVFTAKSSPTTHPHGTANPTAWNTRCDSCPAISASPATPTVLVEHHDFHQQSTPQDSQDPSVTRFYPSPPLTGSSLKQSKPLPEVTGRFGMEIFALPDSEKSRSRSTSHDECHRSSSSTFEGVSFDSGQFHTKEYPPPLSPPPTLPVTTLELPDVAGLRQDGRSNSTPLPQGLIDKTLLRLKRRRLTDPNIQDEEEYPYSSGSRIHQIESPLSPTDTWVSHSDTASTICSPEERSPKHSFSWDREPPPMDWNFDSMHPYEHHFTPEPPPESHPSRPMVFPPDFHHSTWHHHSSMDVDLSPPASPRAGSLGLPLEDPDLDRSYDTIMPPDDEDNHFSYLPPSSPSHRAQALPDFGSYNDTYFLTPVPRSPHAGSSLLPDLDMDEPPPSSPRSPHLSLPPLDDDMYVPPADGTISPTLLSPQPMQSEGLGLFIRPSSIDPPLARSPSPSEDDLQFLDIQLDPASTHLDNEEFLHLRALRKRAVDAERAARILEASLAERVSNAANALLPSALAEAGIQDNIAEKRARKHELHVAMDLRAEARKARRTEKQKSKEIGALLDLKIDNAFSNGGFAFDRVLGLKQLVASMVMKRREAFRSLANRRSASDQALRKSSLSHSVSVEDLTEGWSETE